MVLNNPPHVPPSKTAVTNPFNDEIIPAERPAGPPPTIITSKSPVRPVKVQTPKIFQKIGHQIIKFNLNLKLIV